MNNAQKNYPATDKECLAIIYSVEHFNTYLYGKKFELVSDNEPLKWIGTLDDPGKRLTRWKWRIRKYDYEFVHKSGKLNVNAHVLSRNLVISDESSSSESGNEIKTIKILPLKSNNNRKRVRRGTYRKSEN